MDVRKDGRMDGRAYPLTEISGCLFVEKHLVYPVNCKRAEDRPTDVPTDGPTDRPTEGPLDRQMDRDETTHLKNVQPRNHQLERPILSNFNLSPSRDAVDDQFQHTLDVLLGITME